MLRIPVTHYVKRFLANEFGEGPYLLDTPYATILQTHFLSVHLHSTIYSSLLPQDFIHIHISRRIKLLTYFEQNAHHFENAIFGAELFFTTFSMEIRQGIEIARHQQLNRKELSTRMLVERFMRRINLSEEEYSLDNLMRQYSRQNAKRKLCQGNYSLCIIKTN